MSTTYAIDPEALAKLRKIWELTRSPMPGEAAAARSRAVALAAKYGIAAADIPGVLETGTTKTPPARRNVFDGFDDWMEQQEPGYKAREAAKRTEQARDRAAFREAVIRKYGSKEAAVAPDLMEQAIEAAAAPFKRQKMKTYANGVFETETLDGWTDIYGSEKPPHRVRRAIEEAIPLPTTIAAAKAEYDTWRERDNELQAVWGGNADSQLSLACELREKLVEDLLETGLRAATLADLIIRQRHAIDGDYHEREIMQAVLEDLEHLARLAEPNTGAASTVQSGQHATASMRRAEIISLLSNLDTSDLPDREIARRVGASPQTVGNIRRRLAARASR
jgi:hypothetical protein